MKNILIAVLTLALCSGRSVASPAAYDLGLQLMAEKRYPEAVKKLEQQARKSPGSPEVLLNLGWAYWHAKRVNDAWRVGKTLVKLDPENRTFLVFLANTSIERKDYRTATALINRALKQAPGDYDASMVLARALFFGGDRGKAMDVLDSVLERFPDDPPALYRRAVFLAEMGRKREALTGMEKLLVLDPTNASYRRSRAKILSDMGRDEEAKDEWKSLTRKQTDAQSLMNLGWTYWRERNYDAAWDVASTLVKLDDKNPAFLRFMANMEIERMNYDNALRLARQVASLTPGDRDAELTLSKALFRLQRTKEAMDILADLIVRFPDSRNVQYRWAEFLARSRRFDEALTYLDRLVKADPVNQAYRMSRAGVLYEMGRFDAALSVWNGLANQSNPNMDALRRLRDDAFNRQRWEEAAGWQRRILTVDPSDRAAWERLSRIYISMKMLPKALWAIEQAIAVDPIPINAYYMKSEILEMMKNWPAAQAAYEEVIRLNPNSARAYNGLAYVLEGQQEYRKALKSLERIKTLGAAAYSSYQELHRASLLADSGHFSRAHAILTRMAADRHTLIPILLYHGISRGDRSDSIPVESFRGQMRALKQKGYQALTVSDLDLILRGKGSLPEKPILITFDDGRADSFENADPVLKEVGYRVTMFVHLSKLRKPHFHASPEDIARWHATGRWDLQAHGYEAHDPTPLDGFGRKGHFLPNRMWLTSANRLETMAEYRARVENDYRKAKDGVEAIASGVKVAAFAYPYGDYGQSDFSNTPESAAINQGLVKKYFRLAFVQEHYGINTLASNPTDLRRFEVPRYMTAEQLTAHLTLSDPRVLAKLMEATLFTRANQAGRAKAVLAELEAQGIDESAVLAAKGAAFQKTGDITYARDLFLSASERQPNKDGPAGERDRNLLTQSARAAAPVVSAEAQHGTDSETNESSKGIMRGTALYKSVRFGSWVGQGYHADRRDLAVSLPRLREREGGVQLRWFAGRRTELEGFYARREFSDGEATGPDRSFDTYAVSLSRELSPAWRLSLRNGRANVETAAAVRQSRTLQSNGAGVTWDPALNWKASADYDQSLFNDSNVERDFRLRLTKRFSERVGLGASYFRGDSKSGHPEYYTPQSLSQYTGVLTVNQLLGDINPRTGLSPADLTFQYEGGYGVQPAGRRVVHSIKGAFSLRMLDNVSLSIQGNYAQSPTYISRRGEGTLAVNF